MRQILKDNFHKGLWHGAKRKFWKLPAATEVIVALVIFLRRIKSEEINCPWRSLALSFG